LPSAAATPNIAQNKKMSLRNKRAKFKETNPEGK
jgi:hypothetical protein